MPTCSTSLPIRVLFAADIIMIGDIAQLTIKQEEPVVCGQQ
jgi:hypothetical protein